MAPVPVGRALVGVTDAQHRSLVEGLAVDHQSDRQSAGGKTAGHAQPAQRQDVADRGVAQCLQVALGVGLGARQRIGHRRRRHHHRRTEQSVDAVERVHRVRAQFLPRPHRRQVLVRRNVAALHDAEGDDGVERFDARIDEVAVDVVGLGRNHEPPGVETSCRRGRLELDVHHLRAEGFHLRDRLPHQALDLGVAVLPEHRARHSEGQPGDTPVDPVRHVVRRLAAGGGISRIVTLHRLVDDGGVRHVASKRAHTVEALTQRIHTGAADSPHRGLEAGDPAHARGNPDRPAGVGSEPHRRHACRHRDAGARTRSTGKVGVGMPGVVRRALVGVDAGAAVGELHRDGLAEQHHPGPGEAVHDGAVGIRHVVGEQAGARSGRQTRHVVQVLGHVGDAMQGTEVDARAELRIGGPGLGKGAVAAHHRERPQMRLERVDPAEEVLRDRSRRQLTGPDRSSQFDDGPVVDGWLHRAFSGEWSRRACLGRASMYRCDGTSRQRAGRGWLVGRAFGCPSLSSSDNIDT